MIWVVLWIFTGAYATPIARFPTIEAGMAMCLANSHDVSAGLSGVKPAPLTAFATACIPTFGDPGEALSSSVKPSAAKRFPL